MKNLEPKFEPIASENPSRRLKEAYDKRLYNGATGRCDLTDEEAQKKEARDKAEWEALQQRRQERLERWCRTPLDPEAKDALGKAQPEVVWLYIQLQAADAIENNYEESARLAAEVELDVYLPGDLTDLMVFIGNTNPRKAINDFHYADPEFDLRQNTGGMDSLQTLKAVLQMFVSDRWLETI
jgi:hypothetical protein